MREYSIERGIKDTKSNSGGFADLLHTILEMHHYDV